MLKLLVIDDKKVIIEQIEHYFCAHEFEVISANQGLAAMELLNNQEVDLILCDHLMPIMNGIKFVENYFSHHTSPKPVIFMTTQDVKEVSQISELSPVTDIFAKPLDLEALHERIKTILAVKPTAKVL